MALSRWAPLRPWAPVAQTDAQPFAALLDAAASPPADAGAGARGVSLRPDAQKPDAGSGSTAQDGGAAAPSASPTGDASHRPAGPNNGPPTQDGDGVARAAATGNTGDGKLVAASNSTNLFAAAGTPGDSIQTGHADGTEAAPEKNDPGRQLAAALNKADPAITIPVPVPPAGSGPNTSTVTNATHGDTTSSNDTSAPDAADAAHNLPNDTPAAVPAAVANLGASDGGNAAAPIATKSGGDSKGDQKDQKSGAADSASGSLAAGGPQLPPMDAAQPVAAAVVVSAAPDPGSAGAGKPAAGMIADAVKARPKVMPTWAMSAQTTPAQQGTDGPDSSSTADAAGSNTSSASSQWDDLTGNASTDDAQQATDQPQALATNSAALFSQIDFPSLGGTEHFGSRADVAVSSNGTAAAVASNGANAITAPNFGVFAPGVLATNGAAPPAAAPGGPVPLADLAVTIAGRAQAGSSQFDIRLDPPELGRIDVRLDVDGSGQVRTHVTVDRSDTLQLLQSQQPQLERALEQAGLKTADNGLQFTLRDQSFAGQNSGSGGQHYTNQSPAPLNIPDIEAAPIDTTQIYARLRLGRGLDISV